MFLVRVACRHYHVQVLGIGNGQLQVLVALLLDDVEPAWILGDVGIEQVVVDVQQVVDQLAVVTVDLFVYRLALLETLVAVSALACEAVDRYLVNATKVDFLVVDQDGLGQHSFSWLFACVPTEANA